MLKREREQTTYEVLEARRTKINALDAKYISDVQNLKDSLHLIQEMRDIKVRHILCACLLLGSHVPSLIPLYFAHIIPSR